MIGRALRWRKQVEVRPGGSQNVSGKAGAGAIGRGWAGAVHTPPVMGIRGRWIG
jgi:hypothetical protein